MNTKIRWGILGASRIAKTHVINAIQNSKNGSVVAVASRDSEKAQAFADEFGISTIYTDYESLIHSEIVDAIYISVPTGLHHQWSRKAGEAGKPTLCEKPLCTKPEEVTDLIQVFQKNRALLAEASMFKYHPLTARVKALVNEGRIGEVKEVAANFTVPLQPDDIRLQPGLGGGALLDLGYYCVGIMQYLLDSRPQIVSASAEWLHQDDVDVMTSAVLQYPSGVTGSFHCAFSPDFNISYKVTGTSGKISVDEGGMVLWPGTDFKISIEDIAGSHEELIPATNHYQLMVEDFADALLESRETRFSLTDSRSVIEVLAQIRRSSLDRFDIK